MTRQQQTLSTNQAAGGTLNNGDGQDRPTVSSSSNCSENQDRPTVSSTNHSDNQDCPTISSTSPSDGQERPAISPINPPAGRFTERSEPWQLQYYDLPTCEIIEHAKQFSHCDAAFINPFLIHAEFNSTALEYVNEAIAE